MVVVLGEFKKWSAFLRNERGENLTLPRLSSEQKSFPSIKVFIEKGYLRAIFISIEHFSKIDSQIGRAHV